MFHMSNSTSNLFLNVLDDQRASTLAKLKPMFDVWYLAGGTALALQLGHRISFDFDLFSQHEIHTSLRQHIVKIFGNKLHFSLDTNEQLTFFTDEQVKITFATTPCVPLYPLITTENVRMENIQDIAADKAFTIGRRGAYRDYVDLYFILSKDVALSEIVRDATKKYGAMFDEKLFLEQLDYMGDIADYSLEYFGDALPKKHIQDGLQAKVQAYLQQKQATL